MSTMLELAIEYLELYDFSIIPVSPAVKGGKDPFIPEVTPYRTRKPTKEEVKEWWTKWPHAMVAAITGKLNDLLVIDADNEEGINILNGLLPESYVGTVVSTPGGEESNNISKHFYFKHRDGLINRANGVIHVRTEGAYIVLPGSVREDGRCYRLMNGCTLQHLEQIPNNIFLYLYSLKDLNNKRYNNIHSEVTEPTEVTQVTDNLFQKGSRNEDIFHACLCWFKGNAEYNFIIKSALLLGAGCNPPLDQSEIIKIVNSAKEHYEDKNFDVGKWYTSWALSQVGTYKVTDCYTESQKSLTQKEKHYITVINSRLAEKKLIENVGKTRGVYRVVDTNVEFMDFKNVDKTDKVNLVLPLDIHKKTVIFPKSVIVVAGVSGMGKTAFSLNVIKDNMFNIKTYYFNSEMSPQALNQKLSYFKTPSIDEFYNTMKAIDDWDHTNIQDKIFPDALNIIDYLEPECDKPYTIHDVVSKIIKKLRNGIALITVQKKPGAKLGIGGTYSSRASSLYLSLEWGNIEIIKNRFREEDPNPKANQINFEILGDNIFRCTRNWYDPYQQKGETRSWVD